MSVSGVSSVSSMNNNPLMEAISQRRSDLDALGSSLKSNDMTGAQQAFAALQQDRQKIQSLRPGTGSAQPQQNQPLINDLQALQSALNSGDLSAAKSDMATLMNDLKAAHHGHHHQPNRIQQLLNAVQSASDGDADDANATSALASGQLLDVKA